MATTIVTKYGSGAPADTDLVRGELAVDTENGRLYTETSGGVVIEIGRNPSGNVDVTGTVTADGLTSSGPINLTAGALAAAGNAGLSHRSSDNKVYLQAGTGGFNILDDEQNTHFFIDSAGAATFNSSVTVGGDITQGNGDLLYAGGGNWDIAHTIASQNLVFKTTPSGGSATQRMRVSHNGDISFYEDTGTTAKLFWDASEERLGIGTSSPTKPLHVESSVTNTNTVLVKNTAGTGVNYGLEIAAGTNATDHALHVTSSSGTSLLRVNGSGNVGIGTSNPTVGKLQVNDSSGGIVAITRTSGATSGNLGVIRFGNTDVDSNLANITAIQDGSTTSSALTFETQSTGGATTERMRIDSSGNLALMTDGAEFKLYYTESRKFISNSGASVTIKQIDNDAASAYIDFAAWDNSSLMRLMNSGSLLVGTTSNPSVGKIAIDYARGTSAGMRIKDTVGSGGTGVIADFYNSSNTSMGAITHDSSNITYGGTSDYRLKENVDYEFDGLAAVAQLKPTKFTWIDNPNVGVMYGFIAHEVSDVVAQAVVGEKDAVNEDGSVKPQMLDQSKLIPFLTKAIQEQQATIEALTARIAALES